MTIKGRTAIVGIGATDYYRHGHATQSSQQLACEAILEACRDAGIQPADINGFASYSEEVDPGTIAVTLGIPEVSYAALVWGGGGGGSCAAVGNASAAIVAGYADVVVLYHAVRRTDQTRFGGGGAVNRSAHPWTTPYGLVTPAQQFAMHVRRHMHDFGTLPEHLAQVAITQRQHAMTNPLSLMKTPLTLEAYFDSRMIADPFRLYDCCLENDGAAALIITSADRARDMPHHPAYVVAVSQGGDGRWANPLSDHAAPSDLYTTAGHRTIAHRLYQAAGVGPEDIDVAELYDHFTGMVLLQLEDYGFCERGGSGPFVAEGRCKWPDGLLPLNTHGGNLSEVNLHGTTHLLEGVRQMRGRAANQVDGAELCLVTGGPSPVPSSAMILSNREDV